MLITIQKSSLSPFLNLIEPHPTFDGRLLGRDVLNTFVTIFDGPRRMTTFQF